MQGGSTVSACVLCVETYCNLSYPANQSETYRNTGSLCCVTRTNSIVGQFYLKTNHLPEREVGSVINRGEGWGKLDEGR